MASASLGASHNGKPAEQRTNQRVASLAVQSGDVEFRVSADVDLKSATLKHDNTSQQMDVDKADKKKATLVVKIQADSDRGAYSATAKQVDDTDLPVEGTVEIVAPRQGADPESPGDVSQVALGVFDARFAYRTLALVIVLCAGVGFLAWTVVGMVKLPEASTAIAKDTIVDGSFAERATALICLIAAAAGVVITLFGAWQAGLETRGRLQLELPAYAGESGRGIESEALEGLAKILDQARRLRGTIAVIAAGAFLVVFAMLFASLSVTSGRATAPSPSASPTTSASQTPTPPTAEASQSAATEPSSGAAASSSAPSPSQSEG